MRVEQRLDGSLAVKVRDDPVSRHRSTSRDPSSSARPNAAKTRGPVEGGAYWCGGTAILLESLPAFFCFLLFLAFLALV